MQKGFSTLRCQLEWWLFNPLSRQFVWFIAMGPQGGESISHQEMIQGHSGWGRVWMATSIRHYNTFPHIQSVFSSLRMLNQALKVFLAGFRCLQQSQYIRLLVWWLFRRDIILQCNPSKMEATIISLVSVLEPLIMSRQAQFKGMYTFFRWPCSQIACSGTWAT